MPMRPPTWEAWRTAFEVAAGDRIAQLVVVRAEELAFEEASELDETARAAGGFGSSGIS